MADLSYQDKLADLSQLSTADLASLQKEIISAFEDAESNDDLTAMSATADALDQVREASRVSEGKATVNTEGIGGSADTNVDAANVAVAASAEGESESEPASEEAVVEPAPGAPEVAEPAESEPVVVETEPGEVVQVPEPEGDTETASDAVEVAPDASESVVDGSGADGGDADAGATTAGSMPAALKDHEFKKGDGGKDAAKAPAEGSAAEEATESPDDEKKEDEDAVTAAASTQEEIAVAVESTDIPEDRQPLVASSVSTVVAGADIPQRAAGSEFGSYMEVSESFVQRLNSMRNSRGLDGDQVIVATVQSQVDPERELLSGEDSSNFEKVDSLIRQMGNVDRGALVASGGYCAPLQVRYDIFGVGVTDRPVRDSLAGFQATRGGIRYVTPPVLSSFSGSVGLWTAANDANPSAPATKPLLVAACQAPIDVTTDAVTLQIQFGNLMTRAYPELVARNNELGLIYHARFAEQTLLNKISALSTAVSSTWVLGTARDLLNAIGRLASGYRHRHRLNINTPLRMIGPAWALDAMREDLTRGYPGNDIEWADSQINAALAARDVNITWHIDDTNFTGVQNAGTINDFPSTVRFWIFAEGTFLFLDGGTLDLGIVRDSTLVGTNDYRMFVESFEGLAKVGIESIQATVTTHITGAIVGTITPA